MGGFSNGYVPMFIVVGINNKVYYNDNDKDFRSALRLAIEEIMTEGVLLQNPVADSSMLFGEELIIDVSEVFKDIEGNQVAVIIDSISSPDILTAGISNNILSITASETNGGSVSVVIRGTSGDFSETDEFIVTVYDPQNYLVENFESGDYSSIPWVFSGDSEWIIDGDIFYEGSFSSRSGNIDHNQKSVMSVDVSFAVPGNIIFNAKTSTELNYDWLKFYINDVEKHRISGNRDWTEISFPVDVGDYTFKWSYEKDGSTVYGSDCAWIDLIKFEGGRVTSDIEINSFPSDFILYQNYPNPFNPETTINFNIPEEGPVKLSVFNYKGELVDNIFSGSLNRGFHSYNFKASDLTSGVYFYSLESGSNSDIKKMLIIK